MELQYGIRFCVCCVKRGGEGRGDEGVEFCASIHMTFNWIRKSHYFIFGVLFPYILYMPQEGVIHPS